MATNLAIDDNLLKIALQLGGMKTKKDTVNTALQEFIQRRKMDDVVAMFGKVEYEEDYDYKKMRSRE